MRILAALGALAVPLVALGQDGLPANAPDLLKRAAAEADGHRFSGRRIVEARIGPSIERHEELLYRDGPRLRIEIVSGSRGVGQVIVDDGTRRSHFFPDENEIRISPLTGPDGFGRLFRGRGIFRRGVTFRELNGGVIAGVPTQQIVVADRQGNTLQRLYIHPQTALVLRRVVYDAVGSELGSYAFTELNPRFTPRPDLFRIVRKGARVVTPKDELARLAGQGGFLAAQLSPNTGWLLQNSRIIQPAGTPVLVSFYASPRGRLSLFQLTGGRAAPNLRRPGRDGLSYPFTVSDRNFVLVGPYDRAELARWAEKVRVLGPSGT